jgi:hypothetical protein
MESRRYHTDDFTLYLAVINTDLFHQIPGEFLINQEFSLSSP